MAAKEISVKKYVVRLSGEERERLEALIRKGKSPAQRLLKARVLLKADVSEAGAGWSDSRIIKALDTSVSLVYRVGKQLVEEGFEAVLSRKQRATPGVARIFDGEKEAKLIALACSKPPKGRARWTLRLVERFEWHYTPKHGSWLDLAESELGVLSSQCLDRRIPDKQTLVEEIAAWEQERNANHTKANWQFSTPNARIKLKHLYQAARH